jgi:uncharacterized membrane protein
MNVLPRERPMMWRYWAAIPIAIVVVHIVTSVLAMSDTSQSAYRRLGPQLPINKMELLSQVGPGHQPLPYMAPDFRYAACRFDASKGPVGVSAVLPDAGWSLAIYRPDGSSAYFATTQAGKSTDIAVTIVPSEDRFFGVPKGAPGTGPAIEPRLSVTAREGLIVFRAPDKGLSYGAEAEAGLAHASCTVQAY